jgi:hypothetical protein
VNSAAGRPAAPANLEEHPPVLLARAQPTGREEPWQSRGMTADLNARSEMAIAATLSLLKRPHFTRRAGSTGKLHLCDAETLLALCGRPLANGGQPCDALVDRLSCRRHLASRVHRPGDPLRKDAREQRRSNRHRTTTARG